MELEDLTLSELKEEAKEKGLKNMGGCAKWESSWPCDNLQ